MSNHPLDLFKNFLHQTYTGKISLMTLIQHFPDQTLPQILYDENNRYLKLKDDQKITKIFSNKSIPQIPQHHQSIHDIIQQRTISGLLSTSMERKISKLSMEERYNYIANEFNLSSFDIKNQYELALKNRIEIPPILMRRIIIDAIRILRIMLDENPEKIPRISQRLNELEIYNQFFDHHC